MIEEYNPILELKNCTKIFPGVKALDNVSFRLLPGECHALVGENGAGKSTLSKIICGAYKEDEGKIFLNGKKVIIRDPHYAQTLGISIVHQEFQLIPELNGLENIFLGRYEINKTHLMNWKKLKNKAKEILEFLDYNIDLNIPVKYLRTAEKQIIQLARAISIESKVLILDELTAMLQEEEKEKIYKIIEFLKEEGIGIIYISHRLDEVFEICDSYTVLCDGRIVGSGSVRDIEKDDLIMMMIGRSLTKVFPKINTNLGEKNLEVINLSSSSYSDINISVREGEVVGIAGLVGAGKTELVNSVFGNFKYSSGEIIVKGEKVKIDSPLKSIRNNIGLVPDERKQLGLVMGFNIRENITLPSIKRYKNLGIFINKIRESVDAKKYINNLKISCYSEKQIVEKISGGNQQKIVLAKWLLANSDILLFDEPTRGIDVGSRVEIYKIINNLSKEGKSIIIVSPELEELIGLCHRIYVMFKGETRAVVSGENKTQEKIIKYVVGEK